MMQNKDDSQAKVTFLYHGGEWFKVTDLQNLISSPVQPPPIQIQEPPPLPKPVRKQSKAVIPKHIILQHFIEMGRKHANTCWRRMQANSIIFPSRQIDLFSADYHRYLKLAIQQDQAFFGVVQSLYLAGFKHNIKQFFAKYTLQNISEGFYYIRSALHFFPEPPALENIQIAIVQATEKIGPPLNVNPLASDPILRQIFQLLGVEENTINPIQDLPPPFSDPNLILENNNDDKALWELFI